MWTKVKNVSFQVASRHVFLCCAIVFILFGIVGKLSAIFITIPYPVLGGASIAMFSSFTGVAISNLQVGKDIVHLCLLCRAWSLSIPFSCLTRYNRTQTVQ